MMNLKSRSGFSLIEVLFALTIVAFLVTPALGLISSVQRSISTATLSLRRTFAARSFLYESRRKTDDLSQPVSMKKTISSPPTTLEYDLKKPDKQVELSKLPGLYIEQVTIKHGLKSDLLVTMRYQKPSKKEKKS